MSTLISTFREPIRVLIGDDDPDIQLRENSQIDAAVRTIVNLGKVTGAEADGYAVDNDTVNITPTLTAAGDPLGYAQLVYHVARLFVTDIRPTAWRTRAFSETLGENREKVFGLLEDLYKLEHGDGCKSSDYE